MALSIILFTVIVAIFDSYRRPESQHKGMFFPYQVWHHKKWYQLLTSSFLHADIAHLAFNMITLFFFGPYLESVIGSLGFIVLYLGAAVFSSLPTLLKHKDNPQYASLGASGSVEAVIFSFIIFNPFEKLYLFFIPIGIPAIIFGLLYMLYSMFAAKYSKGNINHDAHIAGAVFGIIFTLIYIPESLHIFLSHF